MANELTRRQIGNIRALRKGGLGWDAIRRQTGHSIQTIKKYVGVHQDKREYNFFVEGVRTPIGISALDLDDAKEKFTAMGVQHEIEEIWVRII